MAIAFDTSKDLGTTSTAALTSSYTTTGSNITLYVTVLVSPISDTITSVTFNGVGLTQVDKFSATGLGFIYQYILTNAPATTANIVVTSSVATFIGALASSYTGTSASQPAGHSVNNQASSTSSFSPSVLTTSDNSWLVTGVYNAATAVSAGSVATLRQTDAGVGSGLLDSNAAKSPTGTYTLQATTTPPGSSTQWAGLILALAPQATATTTIVHNFPLLGVGN